MSELVKNDPNSMAFRYDQDKNGKQHLSDITYINLRYFKKMIDPVNQFLDGIDGVIGDYRQ